MRDPLGMAHGVRDGNRSPLGDAEQRVLLQVEGIDHRLEILLEVREGDARHVPVGQAVTAAIVADQPYPLREKAVQRAPELHVPIELEVVEPRGRPHHRRPAAHRIDGQPDAVLRTAVLDVLASGSESCPDVGASAGSMEKR